MSVQSAGNDDDKKKHTPAIRNELDRANLFIGNVLIDFSHDLRNYQYTSHTHTRFFHLCDVRKCRQYIIV